MTILARNTTALATCLSLLLPHMGLAQSVTPADPALRLAQMDPQSLEQLLRDRIEARADKQKQKAEDKADRKEDKKKRKDGKKADKDHRKDQKPQAKARPAQDVLQLQTNATAKARAEKMGRLDSLLRAELAKGLQARDLRCLDGSQPPCGANGHLITPGGVVVERNAKGRIALAPADRQLYYVDDDGKLRVRQAAKAGDARTLAAREAAQGKAPGDLQALAATLTGASRRDSQRVSDRDYRSSDQDFATSLQQALAGKGAATAAKDSKAKDKDDNDLAKALLLGLGALAVGSMLNNNSQVAFSAPDRVVVDQPDGSQQVYRDDSALLRQPGSEVVTEQFDDGSSRTVVTRADGSKVVTIRDRDMNILRRTLISADGRSSQLIDDTTDVAPVDVSTLPQPIADPNANSDMDEEALRAALYREAGVDRRFTLGQIRNLYEVRSLVQPIAIDSITFDTGSAAIRPDQARQLAQLGKVIREAIARNPKEMFLVEGYTDTVGSSAANLALSDRRAESVALALTEYFDVPPENLVVQGYGENFLKVDVEGDVRANRRTSVRRITDLLRTPDPS